MSLRDSRVAKLLGILVIAVAVMAAAPAAVSAADHVQVLDGDDTDEVTDFDAADDQFIEYELEADGADFGEDGTETVYLNVSHEDVDHVEVEVDDIDGADVSHTFNVSHEDLETLPGAPDETTITDVMAWGEDDDGTITTTADEFEVDVTFSNERNTLYLNDTGADAVDVDEFEPGLIASVPFVGEDDGEDTIHIEDDRAIDGDATSIHVFTDSDDLQSPFDDAADAYSSSGDMVLGQTVVLEGELVPVFNSSPPDWADENSTHAVFDGDELVVEVGEEYEDDDEVEMHAGSHNPLIDAMDFGLEDVQDAYDDELEGADIRDEFGLGTWLAGLVGFGTIMLGGLGIVTVRRRRAEV